MTIGDTALGWQPNVVAAVHIPPLSADLEEAAYQITLEALTNSHRHSGGRHAEVRIAADPSTAMLIVEVADDGVGFSADASPGVGLQSMRDRAAAVGGTLAVTSSISGGALVRAALPLPSRESVKAIP